MFKVPVKINSLLRDFSAQWGVAGGWAIDLFLGKETRKHKDIEVAILRRDQLKIKEELIPDWRFEYIHRSKSFDWSERIYLEKPIHEIYAVNETHLPERLEVLLNEHASKYWVFRRNNSIKLPISEIFLDTPQGIPILHPKIVLLYKVKINEPKDLRDLINVAPVLNKTDKFWLYNAIWTTYGRHDWLRYLV
ncbi:MAG: nucleotidyltransferase domain-containing protein [Chitinophagales bacterium]